MRRGRMLVAAGLTVVMAAGVGLIILGTRTPTRTLVAHFASSVGIAAGSDVRVLGVKIGTVTSARPEGTAVRVAMRYDARYKVPAGASAVIVPPSVVSDRYVQLTPAYTRGALLADGADLPESRTSVPLEIDDVYRALNQFDQALGPGGANANGALSNLVGTGAANLKGNGANLGDSLDNLSQIMSTLNDSKDDLFGTVTNLQKFVTALAESDQQVQEFNSQLASVGQQLAGERDDLATLLRNLSTALADITTFVRDNRSQLASNVSALSDVSGVLVRQQQAIIDVLNVAPTALSDLNLAYNSRSGTLDTRDDALGPYDPASYVCSLLVGLVTQQQVPQECVALAQTLNAAHLPLTDQLRKLLGLPPGPTSSPGGAPGTPDSGSSGSTGVPGSSGGPGAPGASASPGVPGQPEDVAPGDPTLGGILKVLK
ncbi:MCE family protein [Rugosimonospora acidiphila]|uniref:MCE family protein n=1 Tax=Rugosimonospora acidiphila TaxID=556531 RepID=A0ABP9SNN1_9ACTN